MISLLFFLFVNIVNGFIDDRPLYYNEYNNDYDYVIYDDIDNNIISFETYCYYSLVILLIFFVCYFV
jgi:hypothetical protein